MSSLTFGIIYHFIDPPLGGFGDISLSDDIFISSLREILRRTPLAPGLLINDKNFIAAYKAELRILHNYN